MKRASPSPKSQWGGLDADWSANPLGKVIWNTNCSTFALLHFWIILCKNPLHGVPQIRQTLYHQSGRAWYSLASEVTALIKQDIVHHVIERTGLPRTKAEAAVDTVFEGLKEALAAGERIELRGFGVFSVRARKTGIGRNPRTGTEVSITPGKAVRFKPGKELHALETGASSEDGK